MAVDYAAKEREFIAGLKGDTGHDLAEWMAAIDAAGLGHRNDIIDWLRRRGFLFSKASWLERIHHNGGRPIYAGAGAVRVGAAGRRVVVHGEPDPPRDAHAAAPPTHPLSAPQPEPPRPPAAEPPPATPPPTAPGPPPTAPGPPPTAPGPPPAAATIASQAPPASLSLMRQASPPAPAPARLHPTPAPEGPLADVLASAKAYRPLAQLVLREIERACPGTAASVRDGFIALAAPREFAVLTLSPRDVRLGLDLGGWPFAAPLQKAKLAGPPARFGHMAVLTDARQVDSHLLGFVRAARDRANRA